MEHMKNKSRDIDCSLFPEKNNSLENKIDTSIQLKLNQIEDFAELFEYETLIQIGEISVQNNEEWPPS